MRGGGLLVCIPCVKIFSSFLCVYSCHLGQHLGYIPIEGTGCWGITQLGVVHIVIGKVLHTFFMFHPAGPRGIA